MPGNGSRRHWGWHPLTDEWAARVVAAADLAPDDLVLDVGAGTGALTTHLVRAGARVVAVELHPHRARTLRRRFAGRPVTVVQVDAADLRLPRRPFRVVASPPFGVTTSLVRRLLAPGSRLVAADLVLQRAAAVRLASGGTRGAGAWDARWELTVGPPLPRSAFRPPPAVDTCVLRVRRRRPRTPGAGPGRRA